MLIRFIAWWLVFIERASVGWNNEIRSIRRFKAGVINLGALYYCNVEKMSGNVWAIIIDWTIFFLWSNEPSNIRCRRLDMDSIPIGMLGLIPGCESKVKSDISYEKCQLVPHRDRNTKRYGVCDTKVQHGLDDWYLCLWSDGHSGSG